MGLAENIRADIARLREHAPSAATVVSNLFSQGFLAIVVYRLFHALRPLNPVLFPLRVLVERLVEMTCGISIPARCHIGPGLRIHHFGGIVIHDSVSIGRNATLYHGVTLGLDADDGVQGPQIGDNVYIGTGASVLGAVCVGSNVSIGAHAVVIRDVPDNCTVVGIPARLVRQKGEPHDS